MAVITTRRHFHNYVQAYGKSGSCKLWGGRIDRRGYPMLHRYSAVGLAWWFSNHRNTASGYKGIPKGYFIKQSCGNKLCVRADHLVLTPRSVLHRGKALGPNAKVALICRRGHDLSPRKSDPELDAIIRRTGCPICTEIRVRKARLDAKIVNVLNIKHKKSLDPVE